MTARVGGCSELAVWASLAVAEFHVGNSKRVPGSVV
jgi:hypothetical protein